MRVLQFGEGNFLRCFLDWMLQKMTDATGDPFTVTLVQPIKCGMAEAIAAAGSYHTLLRGYENGTYKEVVETISVVKDGVCPFEKPERFLALGMDPTIGVVASNTTEAGIFYEPGHTEPHNYPSLLAQLLHARAKAHLAPLIFLPMELIEHNGDMLKECVLAYGRDFGYDNDFVAHVNACPVYNSLVDRIVPGFPRDAEERLTKAFGKPDPFLTSGELFHLLVLEGSPAIKDVLPFDKAGLNVIVTPDQLPFYRDRKVRVLNGAHTASVPMALFAGFEEVDRFVESAEFGSWIHDLMHDEIVFALGGAPETHAYADEVIARFRNPALAHKFRSIALNSIAKCNTRLRPTLEAYWNMTGKVPPRMTQAIRAMIDLYTTNDGVQRRLPGGELALADVADLKGATTSADILERLFPGLDAQLKGAILA